MKFMECPNKNAWRKKKKDTFWYIVGGLFLIATRANLLDTKYEFHGFIDDLKGTIN